MSKYSIQEVITDGDKRCFLDLPIFLYKDNSNWIHPLDVDIEKVFDCDKNPMFEHGECIRFNLKDESGKIKGRIAAFIDYKTFQSTGIKTGGIGFFECINDYAAAELMFNECVCWLKDRGMEAMDGPINFGPRHEWWGLLVEGEYEPNYCMSYNHPYYINFFENYGFKQYFKQYTYRTFLIKANLSELVVWKADRLLRDNNYKVLSAKEMNRSKMVDDFVKVYNEAWVGDISGVEEINKKDGVAMYHKLKPALDSELLYFAYYKDRPIGFFIMVPDLNSIVKKMNGKTDFVGKMKFRYHKCFNGTKKIVGLIFGVVPDFQSKGVDSILIKKFSEKAFSVDFAYDILEMNWIGDFNPRMMHLMEYLGAEKYKTHVTYRNIFDSSREFKSCPRTK